ncbi:FADR163Wp [Eremothecium gossypii FDAG1]|nr:FADR163Wp [Eremothecium gossypii FDAG1]
MLTNTHINNYRLIKQIGSGAFGIVFLAEDIITGEEYAIKAVMKQHSGSADEGVRRSTILRTQLYHFFKSFQNRLYLPSVDLESIRTLSQEQLAHAPHYKELLMHLTVHTHEHVVTIHQVMESSLATFIVMDYITCDLFSAIVNEQVFAKDGLLIKKVFLQLCEVIFYCHRLGVYHCDLKPENILLDKWYNVHVCDFGLATPVPELAPNVCVGSSYYMAPERGSLGRELRAPTAAGDVWAIGIILINLVCICNPWVKADGLVDGTFRHFLTNPRVLMKILPITDEFYSILLQVLQLDPEHRSTLPVLMEAVANCEHFTVEGPLSTVERLSVEQYNRFLGDSYNVRSRKLCDDYYSEDDEFTTDDCGYDSDRVPHSLYGIGDNYLPRSLSGDGRCDTASSAAPELLLSTSLETNYSRDGRWLPNYAHL